VYRFINDSGSVLFVQRAKEAQDVAAFLARQPRVLPKVPTKPRRLSLAFLAFRLWLLILLALALATAFVLFGEEAPESVVRPLLTAQQRMQAFRL
jgi:sterol desaturase/sphingolipid hydroxylase (fatty acid hydroxylase superfamily)